MFEFLTTSPQRLLAAAAGLVSLVAVLASVVAFQQSQLLRTQVAPVPPTSSATATPPTASPTATSSPDGGTAGSPSPSAPVTSGIPITCPPDASNGAPVVDAGPDLSTVINTPIDIDATVTDDGHPGTPPALLYRWSKVSGPPYPATIVGLTDSAREDVQYQFTDPGTYVLRLEASDCEKVASDDVSQSYFLPHKPATQMVFLALHTAASLSRTKFENTIDRR